MTLLFPLGWPRLRLLPLLIHLARRHPYAAGFCRAALAARADPAAPAHPLR
jgi:hypothetical protein